jgi:hypothetical protein
MTSYTKLSVIIINADDTKATHVLEYSRNRIRQKKRKTSYKIF